MMYDHIGDIRGPLKQDLALEFYRNQNKVISILTKTHINNDQTHQKGNNWLGSNFFSLGDSHKKGCLSFFIWDLKLDTDSLPLMTEFSVFMPLQGISLGSSLIGGISLKDYKIIWKIKIREIILKRNNT